MKKLLLLLTAGMFLVIAGGCMYTSFTSDPQGKLYLTRANLNGFWTTQYICEPNGGNLNCKEVTLMGSGGGEAASAEAAPPPAATESAEAAGDSATEATEEATDEAAE